MLSEVCGVRVFSATKASDRDALGSVITEWIRDNPECEIIDRIGMQSSDQKYHCITVVLFYRTRIYMKKDRS